jgi:DNA-directed RNA polymerase subunit beta'
LSQPDIVLGIYFMTREKPFCKGDGKSFSSPKEVRMAYDAGELDLHASIKVRINGSIEATTTGRILLYEILPEALPFSNVNMVMTKKTLRSLINESYRSAGTKLQSFWPTDSKTLATNTQPSRDLHLNKGHGDTIRKEEIIVKAENEVRKIDEQYTSGLIIEGEKYNKVVDIGHSPRKTWRQK